MTLEEHIAAEVAKQVAPILVERLTHDLADPCLRPIEAARYLGITKRCLTSLELPRAYPTPSTPRYRLSVLNSHLKKSS